MNPRYTKQVKLKGFGEEGQRKLNESRILIVGLGGLGIPAATYLNSMGVGTLGLVDGDLVEASNLHRQVLFDPGDVDTSKVACVAKKLRLQNPNTRIIEYPEHLTVRNGLKIAANYDLILDATDTFGSRYLINDISVILGIPFIYGALHGFEGQLSVFNYQNGPTYRCLFPEPPHPGSIPSCDEFGILGVLPGIIGTMQALEAVKIASSLGEVTSGNLLLYNGLNSRMESVSLPDRRRASEVETLQEAYGIYCPVSDCIRASELHDLVNRGTAVSLIDVRSQEEFSESSLPGAVNIPIEQLEDIFSNTSTTEPTYLICRSGVRSQLAQRLLKEKTGAAIPFVKGGMNEYETLCS
ncbi:MAG: HesA/MoeB/ThiF family protein [Bacteroidia bacterium]|nr:HesA/MoeB/ThiF family protein [Bacteroidia bacterium]